MNLISHDYTMYDICIQLFILLLHEKQTDKLLNLRTISKCFGRRNKRAIYMQSFDDKKENRTILCYIFFISFLDSSNMLYYNIQTCYISLFSYTYNLHRTYLSNCMLIYAVISSRNIVNHLLIIRYLNSPVLNHSPALLTNGNRFIVILYINVPHTYIRAIQMMLLFTSTIVFMMNVVKITFATTQFGDNNKLF